MKNKDRKQKIILVICNIILAVITVAAAGVYSRHTYKTQEETKEADFIRMVDSMKRVSQNYLNSERGYVTDWAGYISDHGMTMEEALDFLRSINTDQDRYSHIVDMDTYEAYSAYYPKGEEKIDTYLPYKDENTEEPFGEIMEDMFKGTDDGEFYVLGKYRLQETQAMAIGIGARVTLLTDKGDKDYLMLRIIPIEVVKKWWVFPTEYSSAEVGIITNNGDYVIQSESMRSSNFPEYIRGYNFQDNYNGIQTLREQLKNTTSGTFEYKNFRGTDCLWYYSSFGENSVLDILGVIKTEDLKASMDAWYIILIVCGTLFILAVMDGAYLMSVNRSLRQASKAKTQFLSAMSHDIRTPLNAVLGMMEIAQKKADNPEHVIQCMDKGINSGKQLLTLINDVLDISKIESGKASLNPEKVSLMEIAENLTEVQEQNVLQKGIHLEKDFDSLPHKYVYADRMRLNQIYTNLLTNAVKYTENGGRVLVRLYEEAIPENVQHTRLIFYVEDTGIGMTEEFQRQMYSTFSREVNTQVNRTQGSGLGLAIVKQMVDLMGGTIECKSSPGKGTSFTVSLELPVAEGEERKSREEMSQNIENMHLLVTEDNALNWEVFYELISELGVQCDHAENGKECVDILMKAPAGTYDAILMDIHMPVMNGYEATKEIRMLKDEKKRKTPIIAMTADAFAEDVQACLKCGMNGHIAKPVDMKKLIEYLLKIKNGQL